MRNHTCKKVRKKAQKRFFATNNSVAPVRWPAGCLLTCNQKSFHIMFIIPIIVDF